MSLALPPNGEPLPGFRYLRRVGRSSGSETWLVQDPNKAERALKIVLGAGELLALNKLTTCRHPFLMHWDRSEVVDGDLFLLSDWAGETLHTQLKSRQAEGTALARPLALRFVEEAAEVLDFLHEKHQLTHGSLKLSNLGVLHRHLKLLDWGLVDPERLRSRAWGLAELAVTAPEVVDGRLGAASDQYALAAAYVQATTGQLPFTATSLAGWFRTRPFEPLGLAQLVEAERAVVAQALDADPGRRFKTCHEFVTALSEAVRESGGTSSAVHCVETPAIASESPAKMPAEHPTERVITAAKSDPPSLTPVPTSVLKAFVATEDKDPSRHPDSAFLNLHSLTYQATVDSRGVLTPTIVLGLGGQGAEALQQLAEQFQERFGGLGEVPNVRLLAVDTDAKALSSHVTGKPGGLTKEQLFPCRLAAPGGYLWQEQRLGDVAGWLPHEILDRIGPQAETGNQRCLGRLAFVGNYAALRERLTRECQAVLQSRALMEATQKTGLPVRQDLTPVVYIVGGLGGSVSGTVVDLAYLVRSILVELGWSQAHITGLFFLPDEPDADARKANAYASLLELHHFTEERFFRAEYTGSDLCHAAHAPFDEAFFWKTSPGPVAAAHKRAAYWLLRDTTSPLGTLRQVSRQVVETTEAGPWRGQGVAALQSSAQLLTYYGKRSLVQRLIARWIHPTEEVIDEVKRDGERFLREHLQSPAAVLARFEHIAAILLGREPSALIDEWVAPLRKGAAARPPLEVMARDILAKVEMTFGVVGATGEENPLLADLRVDTEQLAQNVCDQLPALLNQYLDRPGYRIGASLCLGRMLLDWISAQYDEVQSSHEHIRQEMVRAERTITQMCNQEERSFSAMGRQKNVTAITQDLIDYPGWVVREDMFARCLAIFRRVKETVTGCLAKLEPGEQALQQIVVNSKTQLRQQEVAALGRRLILEGHKSLEERVNAMLDELPDDFLRRLDVDLARSMGKYQASYADICRGQGPAFQDVLKLIDATADEELEGLIPPADAAEQLLLLPSQAVVEQMREAYRDARPQITPQFGSRQGAFCLLVTPPTDAAKDLMQMAHSTLPQVVAASQGQMDEVLFYRETGPLHAHEVYPQGRLAYDELVGSVETSPHSRFDVTTWRHFIRPEESAEAQDSPSELMESGSWG